MKKQNMYTYQTKSNQNTLFTLILKTAYINVKTTKLNLTNNLTIAPVTVF